MFVEYIEKNQLNQNDFIKGMKKGIPVAIGYIPIGIAYGLLAKSFDIPNLSIILMSILVYAGASQFIAVNLIVAGVTPFEIIIATFILNLRHFLMSASLYQRLPNWLDRRRLAVLSFGVTDETFSVASTEKEKSLRPTYLLGLFIIAYLSWIIGSTIGVFFAVGLPTAIQNSMGIALYAMFIGLLVPSLKGSKPIQMVVLIAVLISSFLYWVMPFFMNLSSGWGIIITTIVTSLIGALLFPKEDVENE
jgi:4-azaleucine resistance transporter AzlC